MTKEWRNTFSVLCALVIAAMLTTVSPVTANSAPNTPDGAQQQSDTQSVSGTIAAVGRNSFTLTLTSAINAQQQHSQYSTPKAMTFLIDKNTTVDGRLRVGASADVTYRQESGNNIAINVRVAS